jgi:hypothetical protein
MSFERQYEVVVGGAGYAGVAAALAAARAGRRTALVEKTVLPGGLGTNGLVNIYLPLCDGQGRQVLFGLAEELLKAAVRYGPDELPAGWGDRPGERKGRYQVCFSPGACVLAIDEMLTEAGVDIWYDTVVTGAIMADDRIVGLHVFNKSGHGELRAGVVIDATGDADIALAAGARCERGTNSLSIWAGQASMWRARQAVEKNDGAMLVDMVRLGANDSGIGHPEGEPKFPGIDGRGVSEFILRSRRMLREHYQRRQEEVGRTAEYPLYLPTMAQYRTTRRIVGRATLRADEVNRPGIPDAVGLIPSWYQNGRVWELPYGALLPERIHGLLTAGRCISAENGEAWNVSRVIPTAAFTGEVAGLAAALALRDGVAPDELSVSRLQACLKDRGIPISLAQHPLVVAASAAAPPSRSFAGTEPLPPVAKFAGREPSG